MSGPLRRVALAAAMLALAAPVAAQEAEGVSIRGEAFVNRDAETYLRVLQLAGRAPLYPWSVRGFSAAEVDLHLAEADSAHPWAARFAGEPYRGGLRAEWVPLQVQAQYNSAFPFGYNDGPVWAGKGVTAVVEGGFRVRWGPLSLVAAPTAFVAQNAAFELVPTGWTGDLAFADPRYPTSIDLPQRFGDGRYVRFAPGESTIRADLGPLALGASTASQHWGPAVEFPLVLGNNAGGFPHAFVGTSRPVPVGIGRVHARLISGVLTQSDWAFATGDSARRMAAGIVAVFTPRGWDGLELGATRFFHVPADTWTAEDILLPFQGILKTSLDETGQGPDNRSDRNNQIASVFARWVAPGAGFEVYGEFAREDHSYDGRDLLLQPDHDSGYMFGFRKVWAGGESWTALRGEAMNTQVTHLALARPQTPFYRHAFLRQGHTLEGQILGAAAGFGGAGSVLAVDRYTPGGRWTLSWTRMLRGDGSMDDDRRLDVVHAAGVDVLRFRGSADFAVGARAVYELNRDHLDDVFNLNARAAVSLRF